MQFHINESPHENIAEIQCTVSISI